METTPDPIAPFRDDDTEFALCASAVTTPAHLPLLTPLVTPDDFGSSHCGAVWQALVEMLAAKKPITQATLAAELRRRNAYGAVRSAINYDALALVPEPLDASEEHARTVARMGRARRVARELLRGGLMLAKPQHPDDFVISITTAIATASKTAAGIESANLMAVSLAYSKSLEEMQKFRSFSGISSGFGDIDRMTRGLRPGHMIVLAARPAMGKTALAMEIATQVAVIGTLERDDGSRSGERVAVFEMEMPREELWERMACGLAGVDTTQLTPDTITDLMRENIDVASNFLVRLPIEIYDRPGMTIAEVRATCLRQQSARGLDLVVIDYLGRLKLRMPGDTRSDVSLFTDASRELKDLARELNVPIILLAQLNRECEKRPDKRPMMSDLRESGQIEADADAVWLLYRDEVYSRTTANKGIAELIIAKQRGGRTGRVRLGFDAHLTKFRALSEAERERLDAEAKERATGRTPRGSRALPPPAHLSESREDYSDAAE